VELRASCFPLSFTRPLFEPGPYLSAPSIKFVVWKRSPFVSIVPPLRVSLQARHPDICPPPRSPLVCVFALRTIGPVPVRPPARTAGSQSCGLPLPPVFSFKPSRNFPLHQLDPHRNFPTFSVPSPSVEPIYRTPSTEAPI